jgi:hypothetical protein
MSLLHQWTMAELRKRLQVNLETGGNVSPNKIPLTTGVGTLVTNPANSSKLEFLCKTPGTWIVI